MQIKSGIKILEFEKVENSVTNFNLQFNLNAGWCNEKLSPNWTQNRFFKFQCHKQAESLHFLWWSCSMQCLEMSWMKWHQWIYALANCGFVKTQKNDKVRTANGKQAFVGVEKRSISSHITKKQWRIRKNFRGVDRTQWKKCRSLYMLS